jgi:hypothetical protein
MLSPRALSVLTCAYGTGGEPRRIDSPTGSESDIPPLPADIFEGYVSIYHNFLEEHSPNFLRIWPEEARQAYDHERLSWDEQRIPTFDLAFLRSHDPLLILALMVPTGVHDLGEEWLLEGEVTTAILVDGRNANETLPEKALSEAFFGGAYDFREAIVRTRVLKTSHQPMLTELYLERGGLQTIRWARSAAGPGEPEPEMVPYSHYLFILKGGGS